MMRVAEIAGFLAVSAAIHALAFAHLGGPQGAGEGRGGADRITLAAADAGHAALADRWRASREAPVLPDLVAPVTEATPETALPRPDTAPRRTTPNAAAAPVPEATPDDPRNPAPRALPTGDGPGVPALPQRITAEDLPTLATEARAAPPPPPLPPLAAPAPDAAPEVGTTGPRTSPRPESRPELRPESHPAMQAQADPAPAPSSPAPSNPAPAQIAAGGSAGDTRGDTGRDATPAAGAPDPALMAEWGARIAGRIQARVPRVDATGAVTLRITVGRDGRLQSVGILRSSGNPALDQAGIRVVQSAGRFPAAPGGLPGDSFIFNVPIRFV
ncbi:TonB family protein [Rhodobacterales bacterium HKCCE2091]|nr:TonB family protein [Rhodobacterales bacterium HKCCE2091]